MRVQIIDRTAGPERLLAEAELIFDESDGPLAGLKLMGFSLWRGANADIFVTFPSRAFGVAAERRFFDYLRPADADASGDTRIALVQPFKQFIVQAFHAHQAEATAVAQDQGAVDVLGPATSDETLSRPRSTDTPAVQRPARRKPKPVRA